MITFILFWINLPDLYEKSGENVVEIKKIVKRIKDKEKREWAFYLLENMPSVDLVNIDYDFISSYIEVLAKNRKRLPWAEDIPDELFYPYILPYIVSQEPLEDFTVKYADTLYNLVKDCKSMKEAAIKINEWVYTKLQYKPTKPWDQNALTTIKRGFGRCEEMSILLIKALRTVFIPARHVYSPWWPFTNSNHAWVELWVDGEWHCFGAGELSDLDDTWFYVPAQRTAIVKGIAYGKIKDNENIYKKLKTCTIVNVTPNYSKTSSIIIKVMNNGVPVESAEVSLSVYNYSSLVPVALKYTDDKGIAKFITGGADLFIYSYKDSLIDYTVYSPEYREDTIIFNLQRKEIPDTSFWLYNPRIERRRTESSYKPHYDTLKPLRELHFKSIELVDSSLIELLQGKEKKLFEIIYNAKGNGRALSTFYKRLPDSLKEVFIRWAYTLEPKDIVSIDTSWLEKELESVSISLSSIYEEDLPDSIVDNYLVNNRIFYERFGSWRYEIYRRFNIFRKETIEQTIKKIEKYIKKYLKKENERECFGSLMNPLDVVKYGGGSNIEKYIFMVGFLRSAGIPARIKWNYKGVEYYKDKEWRNWTLEEKEKIKEDKYLFVKFTKYGKDVTKDMRYYYDYSITRFGEYPDRLDPEVENLDSLISIKLEQGTFYLISGWRNGYGDPFVILKKITLEKDTTYASFEVGVPVEEIKPGDFIVRKYTGFNTKKYGIDLSKGKVLILILDPEDEASYTTVKSGIEEINRFKGKKYIFIKGEKRRGIRFKKMIPSAKLFSLDEKTMKEWHISTLPSILLLEDGKPLFWIEGIYLELNALMKRFIE